MAAMPSSCAPLLESIFSSSTIGDQINWMPNKRRDLLEIVEDRYDARSIIITSQIPVERWYEIIGNPTLADAILDRIIHNAFRIPAEGRGRGTVACR